MHKIQAIVNAIDRWDKRRDQPQKPGLGMGVYGLLLVGVGIANLTYFAQTVPGIVFILLGIGTMARSFRPASRQLQQWRATHR